MDILPAATARDQGFLAHAIIVGAAPVTNDDIDAWELDRARHALAYLQQKLGNDAMRALLRDDLARMTAQAWAWVQASGGAWQTGCVELIVIREMISPLFPMEHQIPLRPEVRADLGSADDGLTRPIAPSKR